MSDKYELNISVYCVVPDSFPIAKLNDENYFSARMTMGELEDVLVTKVEIIGKVPKF